MTNSRKARKVHLLIIDPQNDFMDLQGSKLAVAGANEDMNRLAEFIRQYGPRLTDIHVTLDSHQVVDIAQPAWWKDADGNMVSPFTLITSDDIIAGRFTTRNPSHRARSIAYTQELEKNGKYNLFIWPPHCLIGSWGHSVQENLSNALIEWQTKEFAMVDYVTKGTNPFTEHYGGLLAEVPDATDPSTQLNSDLIQVLQDADEIPIAGEALSHCVMATINQIADNIGDEHIKKITILTDATSPVPQTPGGPDFPAIAQQWLKDIQKCGVKVSTTTTFFN